VVGGLRSPPVHPIARNATPGFFSSAYRRNQPDPTCATSHASNGATESR
jgi:hypothetical protein